MQKPSKKLASSTAELVRASISRAIGGGGGKIPVSRTEADARPGVGLRRRITRRGEGPDGAHRVAERERAQPNARTIARKTRLSVDEVDVAREDAGAATARR